MTPSTTPSIAAIATAFAGHRFTEAFPHLGDNVVWDLVGVEDQLVGKDAVVAACDTTTAELADVTTEFTQLRTIASGNTVVVDAVGNYTDPTGDRSAVASCDLFDFEDGKIVRIRSYTVEVKP